MSRDVQAPGSVFGGILLVAGSCIGAGMLALPILTGLAGFFPALFLLLIAWAFMTYTGLLLVEINGRFSGQVNLLSMAQESLGPLARWICWFSYLFLFYSLLVAYTAVSGSIFSSVIHEFFHISLPHRAASLFFALFFGIFIYLGTRPVDLFNRLLMIGLALAYFGLIALGLPHVHLSQLLHSDLKYAILPLPVLIISFGYQNMIPSLTAYLKGDLFRVRQTILGGSLLTLVIYIIWFLLVIGVVPFSEMQESYKKGEEATRALRAILGSSWVSTFAEAFAFFAIVTSFLAQGLSLSHFIGDGLKIIPTRKNNVWLCLLAIAPPALLSVIYPHIFFKALNFAGGICAVILFGLLPVTMVWIGRYRKNNPSPYHAAGGKGMLAITFCFALFIIASELGRIIGLY